MCQGNHVGRKDSKSRSNDREQPGRGGPAAREGLLRGCRDRAHCCSCLVQRPRRGWRRLVAAADAMVAALRCLCFGSPKRSCGAGVTAGSDRAFHASCEPPLPGSRRSRQTGLSGRVSCDDVARSPRLGGRTRPGIPASRTGKASGWSCFPCRFMLSGASPAISI